MNAKRKLKYNMRRLFFNGNKAHCEVCGGIRFESINEYEIRCKLCGHEMDIKIVD